MTEQYKYALDYDNPLLAELYDRSESYLDDLELIRRLIADLGALNILEPFSGTGRVLIPLAKDGHTVTGIEIAPSMNERAAVQVMDVPDEVARRIHLRLQDVMQAKWGRGYDLVVLTCNCFYELPSAEMQEECIRMASESLKKGGHVYVDNNNYMGGWDDGPFGKELTILSGEDIDGTYGRSSMQHVSFDKRNNVLTIRRKWYVRGPNGEESEREYVTLKHPVTGAEVESWLNAHNFEILQKFGDRKGGPYTDQSDRAIFWARKK
jgi:SAM-dependent methyltransferase